MLLTIFTPAYNRAYIINKLYDSLLRQNCKDFEWIVVDDGSNDGTEELINKYITSSPAIKIKYLKTINGGKHRAINRGVEMAEGELFFIVDSDDYLTNDAVECIRREWNKIKDKRFIGGLCFRKVNYSTGDFIGGKSFVQEGNYTSIDLSYKLNIYGDKSEIFLTEIMKQFPFPVFEKEYFVPEALIWNRIGCKYKLHFVNKGIYMCDYLEDGLSRNFKENMKRNPNGFALFYRELQSYDIPFLIRAKSVIRLIQCLVYRFNKR